MNSQQTMDDHAFDEAYMHVYQTMHTVFLINFDNGMPYTAEELEIEAV